MLKSKRKKLKPVWVLLGLDPIAQAVDILGFHADEATARRLLKERANDPEASPDITYTAIFNICSKDPVLDGYRWLKSGGVPEMAARETTAVMFKEILKMHEENNQEHDQEKITTKTPEEGFQAANILDANSCPATQPIE